MTTTEATLPHHLADDLAPPLSLRQLAWRRFRRHKLAVIGAIALVLLIVYSFGGALLVSEKYANFNDLSIALNPPSVQHPFGTDTIGRDILARSIYGGQISLVIGLTAVVIETVLGILVGALAGYYGGWIDSLLMRFTEAMINIPQIFLLIVLAKFFGGQVPNFTVLGRTYSGSLVVIIVVIGATSWMYLARIVRAEFLSLKEREFILAAKATGTRAREIIFGHILPNSVAPIIVSATLSVANAILSEAYISFLGLGVQPPTATWGNMLERAYSYIDKGVPWLWLIPGLLIVLTVLSINFVGDGLRDALDPRGPDCLNIRMTTLLEVTDLRTRFRTPEGTVYAVNGISFTLGEGETLAVVGESGCGKSVSMMSILGLIPVPPGEIVSGSAVFHGTDLLKSDEYTLEHVRGRQIGMIFQDPMTSLNPVLTIKRQVTESLKRHMAMNDAQAARRAIELMEAVGIPDPARRLNEYPHQFSGGMRQRVMIAMALACTPDVLIADEPTTALDVTIQAQIIELVIKMRQLMGMAVIWITHDLGVVAGMADRVVVMYAGLIVEEALVDELYENARHPYTQALLSALPRADRRRGHEHLKSIPGAPPSLHILPTSCPFAPRCEWVIERCWRDMPQLEPVAVQHRVACWVDTTTTSGSAP